MKNTAWIAVVLILAAIFVLEFRYTLVINSPIVSKIDRLTGDVWIANSGMWLKVRHAPKERDAAANTATLAKTAGQTVQGKSK